MGNSTDDYYDFLGLEPTASQDDIKSAYRKLAFKYHPDTGSEKDDELFKKLQVIHSILSDPVQRRSYDETIAYKTYKKHERQNTKHEKPKAEDIPENYDIATFIDGLEVVDSVGMRQYVRLHDYLYYKVEVDKKALFFKYKGSDYYRTKIMKIYSKKKNSFRKVPLFVVNFQDVEHIIFEKDFQRHWLTEDGFKVIENRSARNALVAGLAVSAAIIYWLFNI